jgi:serine/threonine-protein kinase RsbW
MDLVLELEIPPRAEYIAIARLVVSSLASSRRALADERIDDLKLAVSEACTNAIEAQRGSADGESVRIQVWENQDHLDVAIEDRGPGFDPDALPPHPPVTDPDRLNFERGLGIPLIRSLVDRVEFRTSPSGTLVVMTILGGPAELEPPEDLTVEAG